eukprot:354603-Chlamydomonas_euryale.AAC.8
MHSLPILYCVRGGQVHGPLCRHACWGRRHERWKHTHAHWKHRHARGEHRLAVRGGRLTASFHAAASGCERYARVGGASGTPASGVRAVRPPRGCERYARLGGASGTPA